MQRSSPKNKPCNEIDEAIFGGGPGQRVYTLIKELSLIIKKNSNGKKEVLRIRALEA
jgi:hypothetical protein